MNQDIIDKINRKAEDLNPNVDLAGDVAKKISILNDFIEERRELTIQQIDDILSYLVGFFTTSLDIPLEKGTKLLRALTYNIDHQETDVSKLSYIPSELRDIATLGRLNQARQPVYYGCIYFGEKGDVNVAFSESGAKENDTVNVLRSRITSEVNVYFVGIFDYIHRDNKPRFMPQEMYDTFKKTYEYQEIKYTESVFLAHVLCDAFLSDILRRRDSGNLYKVTSALFPIYSDSQEIDGIIYTSVKSEGDPILAIKTESVDNKLEHEFCDSYLINNDYGYAKYKATNTHRGSISGEIITWTEVST